MQSQINIGSFVNVNVGIGHNRVESFKAVVVSVREEDGVATTYRTSGVTITDGYAPFVWGEIYESHERENTVPLEGITPTDRWIDPKTIRGTEKAVGVQKIRQVLGDQIDLRGAIDLWAWIS